MGNNDKTKTPEKPGRPDESKNKDSALSKLVDTSSSFNDTETLKKLNELCELAYEKAMSGKPEWVHAYLALERYISDLNDDGDDSDAFRPAPPKPMVAGARW